MQTFEKVHIEANKYALNEVVVNVFCGNLRS